MPRRLAAAVVLLAAASAGSSALDDPHPAWREIAWPFARDAWPPGRAFRCEVASCGVGVEVFVRPKRGLCANCDAGVTGDWEVDAAGDLDTMSDDFVPRGPGTPVALGNLRGRTRSYELRPGHQTAVASVLSKPGQCDLLVVASRRPGAAGPALETLLDDPSLRAWIAAALEGH